MQKFLLATLSISLSLLFSCNNAAVQDLRQKEEEKAYFPVNAYFNQQLLGIDSMQLPIFLVTEKEGRSDTTSLSIAACRELAAPFMKEDITDPALRDKYIEKSFADQSIPSISFTYSTADSSLPLKRVDIVLKPDPVQADKVKSVYLEKLYQRGDTLVNEKLFWKADHYFQLIKIARLPGGNTVQSKTKVVWDPTE